MDCALKTGFGENELHIVTVVMTYPVGAWKVEVAHRNGRATSGVLNGWNGEKKAERGRLLGRMLP